MGIPNVLLMVDPFTLTAALPVWQRIVTFGPNKSLNESIKKDLPTPGWPVISKNNWSLLPCFLRFLIKGLWNLF